MNENDFKNRFGSNSPLPPYSWSDDDYASGWNITGDMPPTRQQFDALQRTNDDKAAYLLDKVYSSARLLRRSTHYSKGDRVYAEGLNAGLYLECATAGISGTEAITPPDTPIDGLTIIDGGVTWALREVATNGGIGYRQPSTAYTIGNIAYHSALPTGWCLKCTTAGTTSAGNITPSSTIGDTITDGGVTWTIVKYALTTDVPPLASALATPRKIELTGNVTGSADFDGSKDIQIATSLSDAYLPLAGGEVTGAVNFKGGATGNWTGTVGGGHVTFEDTIIKTFDSKQDQNNDFVFAHNTYNAPMFLVSVVTFIYRNTGSSQSIRHFGVLSNLPSGWEYNWLYSKEYHSFIDYIGNTYAITAKSAAPLTINVSFKSQSQDTATASAYTRVWVKLIGE